VLVPSASYTIKGVNSQTRTATPIHALPSATISRVFHYASILTAYSGAITIYYRDAELNSIPETNLTLNIYDGSNWIAYTGNVTRNNIQNFVTTTGFSNISLNELTLANTTSTPGLRVKTDSFKEQ